MRTGPHASTVLAVCVLTGIIVCQANGLPADATLAGQILSTEGVRPGVIVHLGCGEGTLTAELARGGGSIVHGLCIDPKRLAAARLNVAAEADYGSAAVDTGSARHLPYADSLVNLLVVDRMADLRREGLSLDEIVRVLCPGGIAYLGERDGGLDEETVRSIASLSAAAHEVIRENGTWLKLVKSHPAGADEWTHFEYDAARTSVSADRLVSAPTGLRWLAGELWPDKQFGSRPDAGFASSGGRNFYWYTTRSDSAESRLTCRDAYNGVLLWEKKIERPSHTTLLVAQDDRVYVHTGGANGLMALDAATGQPVIRFEGSKDDPNAEILLRDDVLVAHSAGFISAFNTATGKLLWETPNAFAGSDALVIGGERVFFLHADEREAPIQLVCCNLRTGKEAWRSSVASLRSVVSLGLVSYRNDIVLLSSSPRPHRFAHEADKWAALYALSASDGKRLWTYEYEATPHFGRATNVLFLDDLVWVKFNAGDPGQKPAYTWVGLSPASGSEVRRFVGLYNRCYSDRATPRFILTGDMDFIDPLTGKGEGSKASRGACNSGFMPANGLTYTFHFGCNCFNFLRGLMGFSSDDAPVPNASVASLPQVERGPAFGAARPLPPGADDWPTLRHDPRRAAGTGAEVPTDLAVAWDTAVSDRVSSPTVASGRVFVAATDTHCVVCIDAATGKIQWSYRAGGRIDSPPTLYRGLALFGSADGWVYCLRAEDGELAWRLQAAPLDRRIVVRGQIESSWPVHGSVLVQDDVAYFAAGRHTHIDGGIHYYAADPETGKVIWRKQVGAEIGDNINEVLISDGKSIHLGQRVHFGPATGDAPRGGSRESVLFSMWGLLEDNTIPGTDSGGMTFHVRPWAYTMAPARVEPRGISWNHPLKGNLLAVNGSAVYGLVEKWQATPRPRHRVWEVFGQPSEAAGKWTLEMDYEHKPESLVLAGGMLFLSRRSADGNRGDVWVLDAEAGRVLNRIDLPSPPRWDGVAAAQGKLFVATLDGRVICMGKP